LGEFVDLALHDLLHVAAAREGLAHACGVHVQLQRGRAATQHVALQARGDAQHEGVAAGVHAGVHLLGGDQLRRAELRRIEGRDDAPREVGGVFVHHRDGGVVQRLGHGRGSGIDRGREGIDDEHQHDRVAQQAPQFLDAQAVDVGKMARHH
jgi:hypothetical protein